MPEEKTIDKIPFKMTLPVLVGVVIAVATILGGYYNLLSGIASVQVQVAKVYATVENGNSQNSIDHQSMIHKMDDHEARIRKLEEKIRQSFYNSPFLLSSEMVALVSMVVSFG